MESSVSELRGGWLHRLSPQQLGLVGQTSTSWGAAGGLLASMVVCAHILAGSVSSSVAFFTGTIFFLAGSMAGFLHGGLLAYVGRPAGVSRKLALLRIILGAGYSVPTLATGWFVAMLLVLSALALRSGQYLAVAAGLIGWAAASLFLAWAVVETARTLNHLLQRWPDARAGLVTLLLAFLALVPIFVVARPEIWILGVRPTSTMAAAMALVAAVWIVGPIIVMAFLVARAWRRSHPDGSRPRDTVGGL